MINKKRHWLIFLFLFGVLSSSPAIAGEDIALFHLPSLDTEVDVVVLPDRDPFNWPPEQQDLILQNQVPSHLSFVHLMLQAVFWDKELPQVIINHTILHEGDKIGEIEILHIDPTEVVVMLNNYQHVLKFTEVAVDFGE